MSKKLAFCALSLLLCSCTTIKEDIKFKEKCNSLPSNYVNESLNINFDKEESIYIEDNSIVNCAGSVMCAPMLTEDDRWKYIEVKLNKGINFPQKDGIYKFYKDYSFNNCSDNLYKFSKNQKTDSKGNYCIAVEKIIRPVSNVKLYTYKFEKELKNGETEIKSETKIFINNELYAKYYTLIKGSTRGVNICKKNTDSIYEKIINKI